MTGAGTRRWLTVLAAAALAAAVCLAVLKFGGATKPDPSSLDLDPGNTPWLLPVVRLAMQCAAVATVGFLLAAAFLVPGEYPDGRTRLVVAPAGQRWLHLASWSAIGWSTSAAAAAAFTMSDLLGVPVGDAATTSNLYLLITEIAPGEALAVVFVLTLIVAIACQFVRTVSAAAAVALLAVAAVVPPAFTGHAASAPSHELATSSLMVHVVAAVLWCGGLLALLVSRREPVRVLAAAVARFSRLALACFVLVAVSGVLNALQQVNSVGDLLTRYGVLLAAKVALLGVLAGIGYWHRRRSLPALAAGRPGGFVRMAGVEVVVLGATFGLAGGLARTPPPSTLRLDQLVQIPLRQALLWLPDLVFLTVAAAAIGAYLVGVRRLRRHRAQPWPVTRTAAWIVGWVLVVLATDAQLARVGPGGFSLTDRTQHLVIGVLAPLLLAAGAGRTVARLALRPSSEPGMRGPSEWLAVIGESAVVRGLSHPVGVVTLFAASVYALYLGVQYSFALTTHGGHLGVFAFALLSNWFVATRLLDVGLPNAVRITLGLAVLAPLGLLVIVLTVSAALPSDLSDDPGRAVPPSIFSGQWVAITCLSTLAVWIACSVTAASDQRPTAARPARDLAGTDLKITPVHRTLPRARTDAQTPNAPRRSSADAERTT